MALIKANPFSRKLLDKYQTGDTIINSTIRPKIRSLAFLIQKISAPFKTKQPVAEHIADIVMISGIPHVQTILKTEEGKKTWKFWKTANNYRTGTVTLKEYLEFYVDGNINIYYCPLGTDVRKIFDQEIYITKKEYLDGKLYATVWQFIKTGIDDDHIDAIDPYLNKLPFYKAWIPRALKWAFNNSETASKFTCSAGKSYKDVDSFLAKFNYSEDTPQDIAEKMVYAPDNYLIKGGVEKQLYNYNSIKVALAK